jgi:ribokinase
MTSGGTVLVAGSANLDLVIRAPRIPAPGETVLGHDFATFPGGKGANQAVACARAGGAATRMLLALGADDFAAPLEASLRSAGVELDIVRSSDQSTGVAFICLSDDAENAITVAPGANNTLQAEHLPVLSGVSHLLLQLETPLETVTAWARKAQAAGVAVVLNAAPAQQLLPDLLAAIDVLIVNEGELAMIAGVRDDISAALAKIDVDKVIVTLGARGCCARSGGQILLQPSFVVEAVDTTGAGDTFCGTLVAALAQHSSFEDALLRACAASALACTRLGAQSSVPAVAEVDQMLATGRESGSRAELARYCRIQRPD